jgi:hypothetical protein
MENATLYLIFAATTLIAISVVAVISRASPAGLI